MSAPTKAGGGGGQPRSRKRRNGDGDAASVLPVPGPGRLAPAPALAPLAPTNVVPVPMEPVSVPLPSPTLSACSTSTSASSTSRASASARVAKDLVQETHHNLAAGKYIAVPKQKGPGKKAPSQVWESFHVVVDKTTSLEVGTAHTVLGMLVSVDVHGRAVFSQEAPRPSLFWPNWECN